MKNVSAKSKIALLSSIIIGCAMSAAAYAEPADLFYSSKDLHVIERSIPDYPHRAELSGIEGYALVEFYVMPDGSVSAPSIADSNSRLFSRAALNAIEEWKFEPVIAEEGFAVPVRSALKFNFIGQ